ncbi:cytochrome P450 [Fictibacillus sp. 23RED33]|uniref:cytochrome P450 n=1 Tax=Fictibacillus sp. 23RED33 TaxID=2745879 RepID=UPI0018CF1FD3|nr:cytochrome P450 [Fictibacillus sp. 23RED33]MBH0175687.1 cytochrome P450 [Fictibacillus sp. 23RED33]
MTNVRYDRLFPFEWYSFMQENHPVFFHPKQKKWHVFKYHDVKRVLSDHTNFVQAVRSEEKATSPIETSLIGLNPPNHRQMRQLVSKVFTPKSIEDLKPRIRAIAKELLDNVIEKGEMDIVKDFAYPLPVIVIAEMLGIPKEDRDMFKKWSDDIVASAELGAFDFNNEKTSLRQKAKNITNQLHIIQKFRKAEKELGNYFKQIFNERRENPSDDLISMLIQAEVDGRKLTEFELLGFCSLLLVAGNETTTNLIGNALFSFHYFPEVPTHLRKHPEDIKKAIEEVLRYRSMVRSLERIAANDVEINGHLIRKGQLVHVWLGSANQDPDVFHKPDKLNIHRNNLQHVAFGHGIHFCLGAPLARLEVEIALEEMFTHFSDIQLIPNVEYQLNALDGIENLPISFSKA